MHNSLGEFPSIAEVRFPMGRPGTKEQGFFFVAGGHQGQWDVPGLCRPVRNPIGDQPIL